MLQHPTLRLKRVLDASPSRSSPRLDAPALSFCSLRPRSSRRLSLLSVRDMSLETTRKRARLGCDEGEEEGAWLDGDIAGWKRDKEFWYPDGNIILATTDTAFKVYRGPLAHQSLVFKTMLSLPQPHTASAASPKSLTCPVVHLQDLSSDMRHLLRLVMPQKQVQ